VVKLEKISTIASSLGALSVTEAVIRQDVPTTESIVVTDADAIAACVHFADEHKVLTEPACGAALAAVRTPAYREMIMKSIARLSSSENQRPQKDVVVIVCGGSIVNLDLMSKWRATLPSET
jgi:L-serine/L-threonine ammonia-lyase